jgi:general secretion pathway protein H
MENTGFKESRGQGLKLCGIVMVKSNHRKDGFTLLELVIVVFLMTLMLGMSTVFFAGLFPVAKLNATGREVAAAIRHARSLARMSMEKQTVVIDMDNQAYGIAGLGLKYFPPEIRVMVTDPIAGDMNRGKYPIVFHPAGGMEGGTITISGKKKVVRIETDPISGAVVMK